MAKKSEIKLHVELDENKFPARIGWNSTDSPNLYPSGTQRWQEQSGETFQECEAFLLSIWDVNERSTYSIDLWTKNMMIDDMKIFFIQTFYKLADTYYSSTRDGKGADMIKKFANDFNINT